MYFFLALLRSLQRYFSQFNAYYRSSRNAQPHITNVYIYICTLSANHCCDTTRGLQRLARQSVMKPHSFVCHPPLLYVQFKCVLLWDHKDTRRRLFRPLLLMLNITVPATSNAILLMLFVQAISPIQRCFIYIYIYIDASFLCQWSPVGKNTDKSER